MWNMPRVSRRAAHEYRDVTTGVGVLDKAMAIVDAIDRGARTFTQVVDATGLTRPTAHRLIRALDEHGVLRFVGGVGYRLGPKLLRLAAAAMRELPLRDLAHPALARLAEVTGESAQLFVREGLTRVCVDAVHSTSELRTIVEIGTTFPITAGSAGKVFMAWAPDRDGLVGRAERLTDETPVGEDLAHELTLVRRRGWASSSGERQPGVGSVSAPVLLASGAVYAVVSISGPATRIGRISAKRYAPAVVAAARDVERALGGVPA